MTGSSRLLRLALALPFLMGFPALASDKDAHAAPHWTYEGKDGPEHWGDLSPDFMACKSGRSQSPIDVMDPEPAELAAIRFDYRPAPLTVLNNGHTIQVNYPAGSSITVGGRKFELLQFHFHARSEHKVGGRSFPMEIHFVHKNERGALGVVGVLAEQGAENVGARELWSHLPAQAGEPKTMDAVVINARDLLPAGGAYYRYMGSLTTPPCSEGVNWFLMRDPVTFSGPQIEAMTAILKNNARPTQPINNRMLLDGRVAP